MTQLGIALDLGTSGFRGQAIDLSQNGIILSTAITTRHPLPGANVIDHLHFALEIGMEWAHSLVIHAVNQVIDALKIDRKKVIRMAVCGNPIQLSLFQEIEVRDLAFAGKRKLASLGVVPPARDAQIVTAREIDGLLLPPRAEVLIPPAVRHEIGADALAMMLRTGMLEKDEVSITTDYGTNAEMALFSNGTVYTGSTAAGPALEGQQIEDGLLAIPGAISDVTFEPYPDCVNSGFQRFSNSSRPVEGNLKTRILGHNMLATEGDTVNPETGERITRGTSRAMGITGTGVVALLSEGMDAGLIRIPRICTSDGKIHLPDGHRFTEGDLAEAGKAIGSIRAGHITLCQAAGIRLEDVETAYMSGASGTYVNALKAQKIGMIPPGVKQIHQVGNTSLAMAGEMVREPDALRRMKEMADDLRQHHCMFAASKVFEKVYILELSYWTEGMDLSQYQKFLRKYNLPPLAKVEQPPEVIRWAEKDIPDLGIAGLHIIPDIGRQKKYIFPGCLGDAACAEECPETALKVNVNGDEFEIVINISLCDGVACRRCERICSEKIFNLMELITS